MTPITTLGPDVELAILRDMPRGRPGGTFVHSTNILYTSSDLPLGDSPESLPHIKRDQITLTKFLGSGAFGEVFEGKAKCLDGIAGETRVAVKVSISVTLETPKMAVTLFECDHKFCL